MPEPEADEMQVDGKSSDTKTDGQEIARLSRLQKSLILPQDAEYHKMLEDKILGLRRQITASKPLDTQIQTLTAALERKEEKLQQRLDGIAELQMEIKQIESERDTLKKDLEALKQEKLLELTNNNGVTEVPLQAQQQLLERSLTLYQPGSPVLEHPLSLHHSATVALEICGGRWAGWLCTNADSSRHPRRPPSLLKVVVSFPHCSGSSTSVVP